MTAMKEIDHEINAIGYNWVINAESEVIYWYFMSFLEIRRVKCSARSRLGLCVDRYIDQEI